MREELTLASLATMQGGRYSALFLRKMREAEMDCADRPGVKKPRVITMTVSLTPEADDEQGDMESCNVDFGCNVKLPPFKSKPINMAVNDDGRLFYNDYAPENAKQRTIDEAPKGPKPVQTEAL